MLDLDFDCVSIEDSKRRILIDYVLLSFCVRGRKGVEAFWIENEKDNDIRVPNHVKDQFGNMFVILMLRGVYNLYSFVIFF